MSNNKSAGSRTVGVSHGSWVLLVLALIWGGFYSLKLGQDINWDLKNYHLYNPWVWLTHRLDTDLYTVGVQTYFSPLLDVPYFLLATRWLANYPRVLAFLTGLPAGLLAYIVIRMTWIMLRRSQLHTAWKWVLCAVAVWFALSGVSVITQVGTTTNEISVAVLVIGALYLLLNAKDEKASEPHDSKQLWLGTLGAGVLMGCAVGFKLTAAVYAPGLALVCLVQAGRFSQRITRLIVFTVVSVIVSMMLWLPWALQVYHLTGNPTFPLMNHLFRSPWIDPSNARDMRFMPRSFFEAVFYPFQWIKPSYRVMELSFADPRLAVAEGLLLAGAGFVVMRSLLRKLRATSSKTVEPLPTASPHRAALLVFLVVSYAAWCGMFSIYRYAVPLQCVAALLFVDVLLGFSRAMSWKAGKFLVIVVGVILLNFTVKKTLYADYGHVPYAHSVFGITAPKLADHSTVLFVNQPIAFAAPFIGQENPDAVFVGVPTYFDPNHWELARRVREKIAAAGSLYVLFDASEARADAQLSALGVTIDMSACQSIQNNLRTPLELCRASR